MNAKNDLFPETLEPDPVAPEHVACAPKTPTIYEEVNKILNEPGLEFLVAGQANYNDCIKEVREHLLKRKNKTTPFQKLANHIELAVDHSDEPSDILLQTLLSFDKDEIPRWTTNGCQTLGHIFEDILKIIYKSAFPNLFEKGKGNIRVKEAVLKAIKDSEGTEDHANLSKSSKFQVDIVLLCIAMELKYRCANGQGSKEQSRGAKNLRAGNFCPIMCFLRNSPNAEAYGKDLWYTPQAEAALSLIYVSTGIDFIAFMQDVVKDPKIKVAITSCRNQIFRKTVKEMVYRMKRYSQDFCAVAKTEMKDFATSFVNGLSPQEKNSLLEELIEQSTPEELHSLKQRLIPSD